jgi:hypothetical protein
VAVHKALSPDCERSIQNLFSGLKTGSEFLPDLVPGIIEFRADKLTTKLIQGRSLMPQGGPESQLQTAIMDGLKPLGILHCQGNAKITPDQPFLAVLSNFVKKHERAADLGKALAVLDGWDWSGVRSVTVHGDYWLNNLLVSERGISGVVDWDRSRRNGCAALDALHLGFMSYAMWADKYVSEMLAPLWTGRWEYAWLADYSRLICDMFSVTYTELQRIAALLWLSYFYYADDGSDRTEWNEKMIEPVSKAIAGASARMISAAAVASEN